MLRRVRLFLEMIRFSHTLFALPFALTSAALAWDAQGAFAWEQLVGIVLCMVFARTAAMGFNRLVDRHYDALNPRTAQRHLPAGTLSYGLVLTLIVLSSLAFIAASSIFWFRFGNPYPPLLSIPVLGFVCAYSYTKRFTALAHFWLGVSLCLAPLAAWLAIRHLGNASAWLTPGLLSLAVLFWVAGFDILYACQDIDFDRKQQLHSVPAKLGIAWSLRLALLCHLVMLVCLYALAWCTPALGKIYLTGVFAVTVLLVYEHWLVRPTDLSRVNLAFFHVNSVISVGLFAVVLVQLAVNTWLAPTVPPVETPLTEPVAALSKS